MFAQWAVRHKLLSGFGVLILLMISISTVALHSINSIRHDLDDITLNRYPKVVLINDIIKATLDNGGLIRSAILDRNASAQASDLDQMERNRTQIRARLSQMDAIIVSARGKQLLAAIHANLDRLDTVYPQLEQPIRSADTNTAVALLNSAFVPINRDLWQSLEALNAFQRDQMNRGKDDATAAADAAFRVVLIMLGVTTAIGIWVALMIANRISRPLRKAVELLQQIEQGDLRGNEVGHSFSKDETRTLTHHLHTMRTSLRVLIEQIQRSTLQVAHSAMQISEMARQVASTAQVQSQATSSAAATIEQLTVSINHVADNSSDATRLASDAGKTASHSKNEVNQSTQQINFVSDMVSETAGRMQELSRQVMDIGTIITVIREVADQTSLLALNAAIESARAGEAGRGFAVVADEVRKLADRTASCAHEITDKIQSVQKGASEAVESMNRSQGSVGTMQDNANRVTQSMQQIEQGSRSVVGTIESINAALTQQRTASNDLAQRMEQVAQVSESTSATVKELAATSQQMSALSHALQGLVEKFQLN